MTIGERLQRLREIRGWGPREVADLMGVTRQTIWTYEAGLSEPKIGQAQRFVESLGIPLDVLSGPEPNWPAIERQILLNRVQQLGEDESVSDGNDNVKSRTLALPRFGAIVVPESSRVAALA